MVTATARLLVLIGCTLLFSAITSQACANTLELVIDKRRVELGKPLLLTLTWNAVSPSLETINLEALRRDFYVSAPPAAETLARQQRWTLRLYAYASGEFELPALQFGTAHTRPVTITVTPAIDPKDKTVIEMATHISTTTPWLKQQVRVAVTIINSTPIVVLTTQEPATTAAQIQGFTPVQTAAAREPANRYRHTLGWHVYPLRQGEQTLGPFMVFYQRDGIRTHQFVLPPLRLEVSPLPSYLPATIPVGRLSLHTTTPPPWWQLTGRLHTLQLRLVAQNMLESDLPDLHQQIRATPALNLHSAQEQQQRLASVDTDLIHHDYQVPYTANNQGLLHFPSVNLQYFDPELSRLQTKTYPGARIVALHGWFAAILFTALLWSMFCLSRLAIRWLRRYWRCMQGYREARRLLAKAKSAHDIREVLRRVALAEGWPVNMTLSDWQYYWNTQHQRVKIDPTVFAQLSIALYHHPAALTGNIPESLQLLFKQRFAYRHFLASFWLASASST